MKKVSKQLMAFYIAQIALALVFVVLFELELLPVGTQAFDKQSEFILTAVMEISRASETASESARLVRGRAVEGLNYPPEPLPERNCHCH